MQLLRKLFDTSKRDVEALEPLVERINAMEPEMQALSEAELKAKTQKFKDILANGGTLDEVLPEAFAVVREVSTRLLGMRHFDVQLVGAMVLHQGRIAEMKTGEGKTLVAAGPLYLNALTGRGAHLVTVNDYLARRDAVWNGPIYHFLGMSVGVIQGQSQDSDELGGSYIYTPGADVTGDPRYLHLTPCTRREAYLCDIVYGTNHEFGFDYLRDNMAFSVEDLVMRELHYAIIDEVDSILIDEARTPHIISGPSMEDVSVYKVVNEVVKKLTRGGPDDAEKPGIHYTSDKKNNSASLTEEGMDLIEEMMGIDNIANDPKLFHHVNASVKAYGLFERDVDYVVRGGEVIIVDENTGRMMFGRRFSDGLHQALEAKENVPVQRESQTVATITFQNLFRLYEKLAGMTGTAKTEEDEFRKIYGLDVVCVPTHRTMIREDHADVVYKTLEAKYRGVALEILRLYTKQQPVLVGTRSIEMSEAVSSRLTSEMLQKLLLVARLRDSVEVKKDIPKDLRSAAVDIINTELKDLKRQTMSALLSKTSIPTDPLATENTDWALQHFELTTDNLEYLTEALKHGIPHNVLNAKFHEREALIIAEAGRKGQITIATNMAGRGVDILLGGRISDEMVERSRSAKDDPEFVNERKDETGGEEGGEEQAGEDGFEEDEYANTFASYRRGGQERAAPPLPLTETERHELAEAVRKLGGLYILGTERHESRRIDNQLRGRSGRQGDPGESRFFVSLQDQLWTIFNANMLENPLLRAWPPMEEVNARFLSGMIRKTQERIENHYFEGRKQVLEYDDVLNAQREHIYGIRREILLGKDEREELKGYIAEMVGEIVNNAWVIDEHERKVYDYDLLFEDLCEVFPVVDYVKVADLEEHQPGPDLTQFCVDLAYQAYDRKVEELGEETMRQVEQHVMLHAVNDKWMDHLQLVDYIREGIGLRGYGQVDPLIAYKGETFDLFQRTLKQIRDQAVRMIYHMQLQREAVPQPEMMRVDNAPAASTPAMAQAAAQSGSIDWRKVGRNDPCPCGSGKKFKACHYPKLRQQGVI
jgi:preprotein translocase subunit SecA